MLTGQALPEFGGGRCLYLEALASFEFRSRQHSYSAPLSRDTSECLCLRAGSQVPRSSTLMATWPGVAQCVHLAIFWEVDISIGYRTYPGRSNESI
jgi:hypothetical protein